MRRKSDARSADPAALSGFLQAGVEVEGRFVFTGTVLIDASVSGEIETTGTLIVGPKAEINASIRAGEVIISGRVAGDIVATTRVELRAAARLVGDVETEILVIDEGAHFQGRCRMPNADDSSTPTIGAQGRGSNTRPSLAAGA
jgi:cytoskeletal protein CcmA (bactofilin family)